MKKKILILALINLMPLVLLLLGFCSMYIYAFIGLDNYNADILYLFISIYVFYLDNYIFIFDSIILLMYCIVVVKKNFCRSFLKHIVALTIINIFNIFVDLFIYDLYRFLMSA